MRFGTNRVFGRRTNPRPEAASSAVTSQAPRLVFTREVFESKCGHFLRSAGFAPDDPRNRVGQEGSTAAQLEKDYTLLQQIVATVNQQVATSIEPYFLLPPNLWKTPYGQFLIEELDMSPYRPWNTLFFPVTRSGGLLSDLPLRNSVPDNWLLDDVERYVGVIFDLWRGVDDEAARAAKWLFECIRETNPDLFPREVLDMSECVTRARADIRTLAVISAVNSGGIDLQTIRKCHAAFLAEPATQLTA